MSYYIANYDVKKFGTLKKKIMEPGRNRTCICGSGKKYKHCCLDKLVASIRKAVIEVGRKNEEANKKKQEVKP